MIRKRLMGDGLESCFLQPLDAVSPRIRWIDRHTSHTTSREDPARHVVNIILHVLWRGEYSVNSAGIMSILQQRLQGKYVLFLDVYYFESLQLQ